MPNYGDPKYWDKRYEDHAGTTFDWLETYASMSGLLEQFIKKDDLIINLGCGNGELHEDMYDDGYTDILNVDISSVCIEQMEKRSKYRPGMLFQVADVTNLEIATDNMFDVAIDKSTIDALLCGNHSQLMVAMMLKEAQRVIKPGGYYIAISYGQPKDRAYHFTQKFLDWKVREFKLYNVEKEKEQKAEED